ncbi:hypothetical protein K3495_g1960 [Podosphaera aphanis]|nr:hypothetical protein K3495_g1960 [Podosphaera aphanis]
MVGRKIEAVRAKAADLQQLRAFIEKFEHTRKRLNVATEDIYNMDETGLALGICTNTIVIASSSKKKAYVKSPENREWVSMIERVSAAGRKMRCVAIFKGISLQTTWFLASIPDWLYTTSENGWTSNEIDTEWLRRIFLPETVSHPPRPRWLILDGHASHVNVDFIYTCLPETSNPPSPARTPISCRNLLDDAKKLPGCFLVQRVLERTEKLSQKVGKAFHKQAKGFSILSASKAALQSEVKRLKQLQDETQNTMPRKRVRLDPNKGFAEINNIMSAMEDSSTNMSQIPSNLAIRIVGRHQIKAYDWRPRCR